jgi:DNA-directed RNA polymerase subunit M/transcription elongation factor TFIIS
MSLKIKSAESFRENIRSKLSPKLGDEKLSVNLEKGVFNYSIKEANNRKIIKKWENPAFVQIYTDRLRSVYINLKNTELIKQIQDGENTPQSVAFMTHQEFNPIHWKVLIDQKIKRDASRFTTNIEASTDMFTCKRCKSKRCTYYELQTRSADEPATIFITCLDCGKHWKS